MIKDAKGNCAICGANVGYRSKKEFEGLHSEKMRLISEKKELERQLAEANDNARLLREAGKEIENTGQARCMFYAAMLYNKAEELEGKK